jgi:hypothetical protein
MKFKVQLIVCSDEGQEDTGQDITVLERDCQRMEQVGLTLAEAKAMVAALQQQIVARQAATFLATRMHCQACGTPLPTKRHHTLTFRTLFGTITLQSPRLRHCSCAPHATTTFSPLVDLLPEQTAPERLCRKFPWLAISGMIRL